VRDLGARLAVRIRRDGPLRFRDWMEACLYDPDGGFYTRGAHPAGTTAGSHFATAPTLHPFLAHAVAREAVACWHRIGRPRDFCVVEFGGGNGRLAADAVASLGEAGHPLADMEWSHVEMRPTTPLAGRRVPEMPAQTKGLVLAHEFVDALPFHVLEGRKGGWAEVFVALDTTATPRGQGVANGRLAPPGPLVPPGPLAAPARFVEALGMACRSAIEAAPKRLLPEGHRVVSMVDARAWLTNTAHRLAAGSILIVDYGDRGKRLWTEDRRDGSVRGFRDQSMVSDVLATPGTVDLTASVDFTQLREWAMAAGFKEAHFGSQEAWLVDHGVLEALAAHGRDTVEDASAYLRLKQLVVPQGFGTAFKVQRFDRVQG
jgi:SAM-dependent MidA family methyltransferase